MSIQSYLSQSTAHGLAYIGNSTNKITKLIWLILTILTLSCFTFHSYLLYNQLLAENVLVSTFPGAKPFLQPDIVFCSERFFARDYINHPPEEEFEFMLNVSKQIQNFNTMYSKQKQKSTRLIWDNLNLHQLYKAFFHRKQELFLSLKCNYKSIDLSNLAAEINYVHFACFRLNASSCSINSPLDTIIVKFYTHIYGINITYSKLNVLIDKKPIDVYPFIQKEIYPEMEDGIHVYLVQPNEGITEGSTKITARVNSHTSIKVKSTEISRISINKAKCEKDIKYTLLYNLLEKDIQQNPVNITTESLCSEITFQRYVYSDAKCVLKIFPIPLTVPPNLTFCGDLGGSKLKKNMMMFWNVLLNAFKLYLIKSCKSNVSCTSIRHTATVNYNNWPRTSAMRSLFRIEVTDRLKKLRIENQSSPGLLEALNDFQKYPTNVNSWKRNFLKISISPGEFMSTVIEESSAYTYKNFFSDVGGIMGFYIGASMLTLFELFRAMHCTVRTITKTVKRVQKDEEMGLNEDNVL